MAQQILMRRRHDLIGLPVQRIDLPAKVTGSVIYTRDMKLPRMLHACAKRCSHTHARIVGIDTSRAERIPGVKAIISGRDFAREAPGADTPPLAYEEALYSNQAVAAVAAETRAIAEEAIESIQVTYEVLPPLLDPELAMSKDTPVVITHPGEKCEAQNVGRHIKLRAGDVEDAFRTVDHIVEGAYFTAIESQLQLEPPTFLAKPDYDGGFTIWVTSSGPHKTQFELARYLQMNPYLIRVRVPMLGGWFGSKEESHMAAVCAKLALKSSRPVKLELSREESMTALGTRHPARIYIKDGVSKKGRILARKVRAIYDGGAYGSLGNSILKNSVLSVTSVYDIPNLSVDSYRVYTTRVPGTPKPGTIGPQTYWAIECQMDRIADLLGIDPLQLRLMNIIHEGGHNAIGERMQSICYDRVLMEAAKAVEWHIRDKPNGSWRQGKGMAVASKWASGGIGQAMVRVRETGEMEVWVDIVENGQGIFTGIAQIVATEFGVPIEKIILMPYIEGSQSESSGLADGASSSRQLVYMGNAVILACNDAKNKIKQCAAKKLGLPADALDVQGGEVFAKDNPNRSIRMSELFSQTRIYSGTANFSEAGEFVGYGTQFKEVGKFDPETGTCLGQPISPYYVSVAQAIDLSVNVESGQIKINRIVAAMDVGKAINPTLVKGQIINAVMMGLSATLSEELLLTNGRFVNANLADYKTLAAIDAPEIIPVIVEVPYSEGPYGAKGAGNPSILPTAPAVRNAIHDATGVWINSLPITPERVLEALSSQAGAT